MSALDAITVVTAVHPVPAPSYRRENHASFLADLEPGRYLRAKVHATLPNNEAVVMLYDRDGQDGQALQMKLPPSARQGDSFNLIFLSREPRPTFRLVFNAPALASPQVSETGRFISTLLQSPLLSAGLYAQSDAAPLLPTPPGEDTQWAQLAKLRQLTQGLAQTISLSGLFYESHLAQWTAGKRSLRALLLEPQARLSAPPSQSPDTTMSSASARVGSNSPTDTHDQGYGNRLYGDALVRQQLDVLETGHIRWQGEVWPGQTVEWDTAEERMDESEQRGPLPGDTWKTSICLTLPNLGFIRANLRLDEFGVEVLLKTAEPAAAAILRSGVRPFAVGLDSAGIKLLSMGVQVDEETPSA